MSETEPEPESFEELSLAEMIEAQVAQIYEHFDAVQILVSWNENGQTKCLKRGAGNWYARQGMAHEFITEDVAQETAKQIAEQMPQPPEPEEPEEE